MPDVATSAWIAAGCGAAAALLVAWTAARAWRQWTRTRDARLAAGALVDVHRARLDAQLDGLGERAATVAGDTEELRDAIEHLRADVAHLHWLATRVPEGRRELREALLDLVLPGEERAR